ncbi:MAG: hypothetical protein HGA83_04150, partial [Bacteroidales bacterium]|nr:hypothetical protein [Bacteroidales bacterium]
MGKIFGIITDGERYLWKIMRNYMPRWTIFLFDEIIVALSFISLWLFRDNIAAIPAEHFAFKFLLAISVFSLTSMAFRTYHGVVRFSTMVDLKKLSNATIAATIVYLGVALLCTYTKIEG